MHNYDDYPIDVLKALLEYRKYAVKRKETRESLLECLKRSDLGLLSYTGRPNSELRDLVRSRGLETNIASGNKGTRAELLRALNDADDSPEFGNFVQLPTEVRAIVYQRYLAEIREDLVAPEQPPLSLTNSLIRREVLPLFYRTCTFVLRLVYQQPVVRRYTKIPTGSQLWLYNTRATNIAEIRKLDVRVIMNGICAIIMSFEKSRYTDSDCEVIGSLSMMLGRQDYSLLWQRAGDIVLQFQGGRRDWKLEHDGFFTLQRDIEELFERKYYEHRDP